MEKPTPDALVSSPYFSSSPNSYIPSDNQGKEEFSVGIPSLAERPPPIPITNPMLRQTGPRPAIHDVKEYQQQITQESKGKQKYKRANSKFSSIKDQAVNNFAISPTSLTTTFQATSPISSKLSRRDYRAILSDTNLSSSKIFEESEVMNGTITPAPMVIKSYAPRNSGPITPLNDPIEFDSIPTRSTWASRGGETSFISPTTFTRTQFHPTIFKPDILNINRSKYVPISYSHPSVIPFSSNGSLPKSPKSLEKKKKLRPQISSETSQFYASCDPAIFRPTIIRSVQAKNNNSHIQISSGSDTDHISQTLECPSVGKPTESRRSSLDDFLNSRKNTLDDFQFSCEPSASQSTKSQKNSKVLETDSDIDPDFHPSFKDLCARRSSRRLASIQSTTASQSNPFYDGSEDLLFTNEFSVDTLKHKNYRELFYYPIHEFQGDSSSAAEAGVEVPQHRILIRQEELDRIEPRQYLNDTLIDFYYK